MSKQNVKYLTEGWLHDIIKPPLMVIFQADGFSSVGEKMPYPERKQLYTQIEALRERPLISFFTSLRPFATGSMAGDSISEFIKQFNEIPKEKQK